MLIEVSAIGRYICIFWLSLDKLTVTRITRNKIRATELSVRSGSRPLYPNIYLDASNIRKPPGKEQYVHSSGKSV